MPQINSPSRAPDPWAALTNAFSIGEKVYGVKMDKEKFELAKQEAELGNQVKQSQLLGFKAEQEKKAREERGEYTPAEISKLAIEKNYDISDTPLAKAIKVSVVDPNGKRDIFLSRSKDDEKASKLKTEEANRAKIYAEIGKVKSETAANSSLAGLPATTKKQITDISDRNAKLIDIKNGIDAGISQLMNDKLSEDEKIQTGRGMLKILNSAEGSDAVGVEEAKSLGSFLEYKIANFTGPGSFIGRDLDLFTNQVRNKSQEISNRIMKNESAVARLMKKESIGSIADSSKSPSDNKEKSIIDTAVANDSKNAIKFDPSKPFKVVK